MKKLIVLSTLLIGSLLFMQFETNHDSKNQTTNSIKKSVQGIKWQKLGSRLVNIKADHDEILVTAVNGVFKSLKFKVSKAPIHIKSMKVVFGNGQTQVFNFGKKFLPGKESKILDLPGNKRIIKKIVFNYKTVPGPNGKAFISVWGRH